VASGEAARLGIEDRCRGTELPILTATGEHTTACYLPSFETGGSFPQEPGQGILTDS
jgi:hypothetical protein